MACCCRTFRCCRPGRHAAARRRNVESTVPAQMRHVQATPAFPSERIATGGDQKEHQREVIGRRLGCSSEAARTLGSRAVKAAEIQVEHPDRDSSSDERGRGNSGRAVFDARCGWLSRRRPVRNNMADACSQPALAATVQGAGGKPSSCSGSRRLDAGVAETLYDLGLAKSGHRLTEGRRDAVVVSYSNKGTRQWTIFHAATSSSSLPEQWPETWW